VTDDTKNVLSGPARRSSPNARTEQGELLRIGRHALKSSAQPRRVAVIPPFAKERTRRMRSAVTTPSLSFSDSPNVRHVSQTGLVPPDVDRCATSGVPTKVAGWAAEVKCALSP
jgi:hypothetical protein